MLDDRHAVVCADLDGGLAMVLDLEKGAAAALCGDAKKPPPPGARLDYVPVLAGQGLATLVDEEAQARVRALALRLA